MILKYLMAGVKPDPGSSQRRPITGPEAKTTKKKKGNSLEPKENPWLS